MVGIQATHVARKVVTNYWSVHELTADFTRVRSKLDLSSTPTVAKLAPPPAGCRSRRVACHQKPIGNCNYTAASYTVGTWRRNACMYGERGTSLKYKNRHRRFVVSCRYGTDTHQDL